MRGLISCVGSVCMPREGLHNVLAYDWSVERKGKE